MSDYILCHHGIKGQKWGVRRFQKKDSSLTPAGKKRYDDSDGEHVKRSMKGNMHRALAKNYELNAKVYKNNNKALSSMNTQARNRQYELAEKADKEAALKKEQKAVRKKEIKETYKQVRKETTFAEALFFSDGTRKQAARYVVDNNMSISDARKKANKDAVRNTAIILGVYGAVSLADMIVND